MMITIDIIIICIPINVINSKTERIPVAAMDVLFTISAASAKNFQTMKNTINEIIDSFGIGQVHYSVIVFGTYPKRRVDFGDSFQTKDKLKDFVLTLPGSPGDPALDKALDEAMRTFEGASARLNATKVLVVIMDSNSSVSDDTLKAKTKPLVEKKVKVVSVAFGDKSDPSQLGTIVPNTDDLVIATKTDDPTSLAGDIMDAILKSKPLL